MSVERICDKKAFDINIKKILGKIDDKCCQIILTAENVCRHDLF